MTPMPFETRQDRIQKLLRWARQQQKQHNSIPFRDITPLYRQSLILFPLITEQTARSYAKSALMILLQEEQRKKKEKEEKRR